MVIIMCCDLPRASACLRVVASAGRPAFLAEVGALTATVALALALSPRSPEDIGVALPVAAQEAQTVGVLHSEATQPLRPSQAEVTVARTEGGTNNGLVGDSGR